jgi:O-antigen chain-terminating methyltransferase
MSDQDFYFAFEERYRGSRELVKNRLSVYLPFLLPLREVYDDLSAIDLGCGRGEWLELMKENGFSAWGVDISDDMISICRERGLKVEKKDALQALQELDDNSQVIVTAFHLIEHLPIREVQSIVKEALRVLKPAGILILETPNPENIIVASVNFYRDPTHVKPIPPQLLSFMVEYYGFSRFKVLRLNETPEVSEGRITLLEVFRGVGADYSVVAQKEADARLMTLFDKAFDGCRVGITFDELAMNYDKKVRPNFENMDLGKLHFKWDGFLLVVSDLYSRLSSLRSKWRYDNAELDRDKIFSMLEDTVSELNGLMELCTLVSEQIEKEKLVSQELVKLINIASKEVEFNKGKVIDLESRWKEALDRIHDLSNQLGVLKEISQGLERNLESERHHVRELEEENRSLSLALEKVRGELESERHHVRELEEENRSLSLALEKVRGELESERHRVRELEEERLAVYNTIQSVYRSWSWRITYPLRLGLDALRAFKRISFSCLMKMWGIFTYPVKWILARAIKFVLNRPRLREFLHRQLVRLPWIYWRLYNFAVDKGIVVGGVSAISQHSLEHEIDFIHDLSPRARQIYEDLKRAIENRRKDRSG